ncbi:MAG: Flp family type IVb pilin [Candidatus Eremiobacteraeota bacterium]|nr:Flp family type IVb pilin [Candidatus Eremiobacteraeota bacterium]
MLATLNFLTRDETAAAAVEYGLLLAAIALVAIFSLFHIGRQVDSIFDGVRNAIRDH